MSKIKTIRKKEKSYIVVNEKKDVQLCRREICSIDSDEVECLVKINEIKNDWKCKIIYDITGLTSLRDFLQSTLTKKIFISIIKSVTNSVKMLEEKYFDTKHIIMDIDYAFINPITYNVSFIFVPISSFKGDFILKDFLLDIVRYSIFNKHEDNSYVKKFIEIVNSGVNLSIFGIEDYISKLEDNTYLNGKIVNSNDTNSGNVDNNICKDEKMYLLYLKNGKNIEINKNVFNLGTDSNNDYVIDNDTVSRRHACIINKNGQYFIKDCGSTNYTYLNKLKLEVDDEVKLCNGDNIMLATENFVVRL